jgi:hypothetical protein
MKSIEEISDRLEIQDLQTAYSHAIDFQDWDALDDVFTPDAHIDYTVFGGPAGSYPEIKKFLQEAMPGFHGYYHMVATAKVELHGDTATGVTPCWNPMPLDAGEGRSNTFFCGLWYRDKYVRTPDGWRIAERIEQKAFTHNMPDAMGGDTLAT